MAVEDSLDIFGSDPFGRDYLYGLSTGRERLGLQPPPQGLQFDTRPYDQMQATPRGFTSGLFSDLLGGTFKMPSMPRTGIPAIDLLSPNMNLLNRLSFGDPQKTAERISYGEPLSTGSGMTLRPKDETVGAALTVAPFIGNAARFGARTVRAGARMVGQGMAENAAMGRPNLPSMFAEPRSSLFAVEPNPSMAAADESSAMRQQLTGKMQALLAQKKVATSAVEVGVINQQIGELQAQFKSLPAVGRVAREVVAPQITAPVSDLGFYSAAEQAAMNLERSKGTGQSFLNDLMNAPDVKKDELSWIGLDDFLKDKPNVTKQEVQDFIASNKIDLQEVRLGEPFTEDPIGVSKRLAIFDRYEPEIQGLYKEIDQYETNIINARNSASKNLTEAHAALNKENLFGTQPIPTTDDWNRYYAAKAEMERVNKIPLDSRKYVRKLDELVKARDAEANKAYTIPEPAPTKHQRWQLAGGENYREILLKMPENMSEYNKYTESLRAKYGQGGFANLPLTDIERARLEKFYANEDVSPYKHSHWGDEPNVLAHIRVNDRIDADGKKMLLVEELQSDWHQAGREKGYATKDARAEIQKKVENLDLERKNLQTEQAQLEESAKPFTSQGKDAPREILNRWNSVSNRLNNLQREYAPLANQLSTGLAGVPDAPFKDTWYQLSLKRILKYAADNGYERVGLTTGKQQVDRFSNELRQNVDEINFNPIGTQNEIIVNAKKNGQNTFSGTVKDGKFIDGQAQGKTVEEVLGKTMAKQIAEKKDGVIKGDNLTVGGEGMKAYYDEIYPKFLEKYGKKWDAGVGETRIETKKSTTEKAGVNYYKTPSQTEPIRYIDITPKMKEGVKKGQPLAAAEQTPEMLASGGLDYADPFKNPLLESTIG